jgi:hypothetical protein
MHVFSYAHQIMPESKQLPRSPSDFESLIKDFNGTILASGDVKIAIEHGLK